MRQGSYISSKNRINELIIHLFQQACSDNNIDIVVHLLNITSDTFREEMIHADEDKAFQDAAWVGSIQIIDKLLEYTPDEQKREKMIHAGNDTAFQWSAFFGYIHLINKLLEHTQGMEMISKMIHSKDYLAFKDSAMNGHLQVMEKLIELTPNLQKREEMIHSENNKAFQLAVWGGCMLIIERLLELTPNLQKREEMIHADEDKAFQEAAGVGNIQILEKLLSISTIPSIREKMIHAREEEAFQKAAINVHTQIIEKLIELTPNLNLRNIMIHTANDAIFKHAAAAGDIKILELLFDFIPNEVLSKLISKLIPISSPEIKSYLSEPEVLINFSESRKKLRSFGWKSDKMEAAYEFSSEISNFMQVSHNPMQDFKEQSNLSNELVNNVLFSNSRVKGRLSFKEVGMIINAIYDSNQEAIRKPISYSSTEDNFIKNLKARANFAERLYEKELERRRTQNRPSIS